MSLAFATIKQLREKLAKKEITSAELLSYFTKRFEKFDGKLGSALEIFDEKSVLSHTGSNNSSELSGIPGLIKDNICQKDRVASCSSKMLENFISTYDATVIQKLKTDGTLLMGRANCDEFAMGSSTEYSAYKKAYNPWDITRVPGGSGGGSAAAVAAGLVPWALGSETGGSVRLPAAFCGIVGSKPTYGLVSRYGLIAYASSLDQIGINTRTVYDNALVLSSIAGNDVNDSSTLNVEKTDYTKNLTGKLKEGLTIGIIDNALNAEGMDQEVKSLTQAAIDKLESLGAKIKLVKMPSMDYSAATYFIISRAEAASNLARFDGVRYGLRNKGAKTLNEMYCQTRKDSFGTEVKARILIGNYVLSAGQAAEYYENAQKVQRLMRKELNDLFGDIDLLICPTQAAPAFKIGAFAKDKLQMDLQDYFTAFVNLTGVPAISIPCGFTKDKLPVGFQIIGPHLSEELIFQTAYAYEQSTEWHKMHPAGYED
ncbi:MAG: Asp-tRNA(Asn)/Glu-tRNA(Gln) amidotransferase subunit GatA [Candidatus Babeliales bacterium]|nr:Asp-tRNA(Asn)/Glu-tRNA(Gln) amidotransferase subunit GatA [Candidatus Babeliales bacterium]